jgi:5-methylcytosine-specific restriction endonuclease McrA
LRRTPLRRVSKKRAEALKVYRVNKASYLLANPFCQVCETEKAIDIHHKLSLGRGGKLNDTTIFMAVCRSCHNQIHNNPKWALLNNYLLR